MSSILNADLHCHSVVSDGTLTPEQLAVRASANGVELWALTDHDEIGGQQRALAAAHANGMKYLTGTEVSITFAGETVHIVGLGFDAGDPRMAQGLQRTRGGRGQRALEMADGLAKVGIPGAYEGALKFVGNPELISRTHFARFLVESGACRDTHCLAFTRASTLWCSAKTENSATLYVTAGASDMPAPGESKRKRYAYAPDRSEMRNAAAPPQAMRRDRVIRPAPALGMELADIIGV